jgi:hypothetical protein
MYTPRALILALLAFSLLPAGRAVAQFSITIGHPHYDVHRVQPHHFGVVEPYHHVPYRPLAPSLGVVINPFPYPPPAPVFSLRPTFYSPGYISQFRPGYAPILVQDTPYYFYPTLPPNAVSVVVGGVQYFQAGGVWYQPYPTAGRTIFLIVPPPY